MRRTCGDEHRKGSGPGVGGDLGGATLANQAAESCARYWAPHVWRWNPAVGPWRPEYGKPSGSLYFQISTAHVRASESYDFWRNAVYYNFDAARLPVPLKGFQASAQAFLAPRGDFFVYRSDPITGRRTKKQARASENGTIDVGLVLSGKRFSRSDRDVVTEAKAGEFFVYDPARPCRVNWTFHKGIHLTMQRDAVRSAFGGHVPSAEDIRSALASSQLGAFLKNQLVLLAKNLRTLSAAERLFVFDQTIDLCLAALRGSTPQSHSTPASKRHGLFVAAQHYISEHLTDSDLSVERIAAAIGCSRSTLYRAFAEQNLSVAEYIRECRLQWIFHTLRKASKEITITAIAYRCGFSDLAYFNKIFKSRFGMNPSDVRRLDPKPRPGDHKPGPHS